MTKKTIFRSGTKSFSFCFILFSLFCMSLFMNEVLAQTLDGPWPMFRQNPQHTGFRSIDIDTNNEPENVKEKFPPVQTGPGFITDITSSPSINGDGSSTVFIGSLAKDFFAIDPLIGAITGTFTTFNSVFSSPAMGEEGRIYVGSWDGSMYELLFNDVDADENNFSMSNFFQSGAEDYGHLRGRIIDGDTGLGIGGASAVINLVDGGTDANGEFFITNIPRGIVTVIVAGGDNCDRTFTAEICGFQEINDVGNISIFSPVITAALDVDCPTVDALFFESDCERLFCCIEQTKIDFELISKLPTDIEGRRDLASLNEDLFVEHGISGSPLIGFNNWIYWGSQNSRFYGWDLDLECVFFHELEGPVLASPAQSLDGTVYVITQSGSLHAFNPDFSELFDPFQAGGEVKSSPAIGVDGTVYFGALDNNLYAVTPDNELKWTFTTDGEIVSSPAIDEDGTIYIGSGDGNLYAIEDGGQDNPVLKWQFEAGSEIAGSSASIGMDGDIYIGLGGEFPKFIAVTKAGDLKWCFNTDNGITSTPAIAEDGTIFVGSFDGNFYAFENDEIIVEGLPVSGIVVDGNGVGIPEALVSLTKDFTESVADVNCDDLFSSRTITDFEGTFELTDIPEGDYVMAASADGFNAAEDGSIEITVTDSGILDSSGLLLEELILPLISDDEEDTQIQKLTITGEIDQDTCFPLTVEFKSSVEFDDDVDSNDFVLIYNWKFGDGQSSSEKDPVHEYIETGTFDANLNVKVSGSNFGTSTSTTINVKEPPCARFDPITAKVKRGEPLDFTDVSVPSEGKTISSREWKFSFNKPLQNLFVDRNTSTSANVSHEFFGRDGEEHSVSLFIRQSDGKDDKAFGTVTVVRELE